jgi:hypothetical protein
MNGCLKEGGPVMLAEPLGFIIKQEVLTTQTVPKRLFKAILPFSCGGIVAPTNG